MAARLDIYRSQDGGIEHLKLKPGVNRVRVVPGRQFRLQDLGQEAEQLRVLQVDSDLVIENLPADGSGEATSLILEGYYRVCSASDQCAVLAGGDEHVSIPAAVQGDGGAVLLADVSTKPLGALSDGTFVLYDPTFEAPSLPVLGDASIRPVLYGLGGAAVLGLALAGGGGGGSGDGQAPQGNISLTLKSATTFNTRFPTIQGTAQPGSEVQVRIDTDGDQHANVTYTTTADSSGNWSVNLLTAQPSSGTLPAAGLSDSNSLEVTGSLQGVQSTLPITTLSFDDTPPASATLSPITGDNIITGPEKAAGVQISGTSEANGSVELKIGNTTKVVAVGADGKWSATLSPAELPATDGQYSLTATAIDAAGNRGPATTGKITLNTTGKLAVIGLISDDNIINAAEAAAPVKVSGTAEAGSKVSLWLTDKEHPLAEVQASANGEWTANVPLPTTLTDGVHTLSATTTNSLGNIATSAQAFTLDKTPPTPATGVKVEGGDNVITRQEAKNGVSLSGSAEAGATVTVSIAGGKTHTATADASGTWKVTYTDTELPLPTAPGDNKAASFDIVVQDAAGNQSPHVTQLLTLQGPLLATTTPTISAITGDNILNAAEAASPVPLSGHTEANASVKVTTDTATVTTTADAAGNWTVPVNLGGLADGQHAVTVTATAANKTAASVSVNLLVDKTPPGPVTHITTLGGDTTISADEAKGNGKISFSGDMPAGSQNTDKVNVTWGGKTETATVMGNKWNVDFDHATLPTVTAGQKAIANVEVTVQDQAGNTGAKAVQAITIESAVVPSAAPTVNPITGDDRINKAESMQPQEIGGKAQAGALINVQINAQDKATATARADGSWATKIDFSKITDGSHPFLVTATLPGGTASPAVTHTVIVDKTPPDKPKNIQSTDGIDISAAAAADGVGFTGTAEAGSTVTAKWHDNTIPVTTKADGSWSITIGAADMPKPPAGTKVTNTLSVTATDAAGNASDPGELTVTIHGAPLPVNNALPQNTTRSAITDAPDNVANSAGHDNTSGANPVAKYTNLKFDGHDSHLITAAEAKDGLTISGDASPDTHVDVTLNGSTATATTDADGHWSTTIQTLPAATTNPSSFAVDITLRDGTGQKSQTWNETVQLEAENQVSAAAPGSASPAAGAVIDPTGTTHAGNAAAGQTLESTRSSAGTQPSALLAQTLVGHSDTLAASGDGNTAATPAPGESSTVQSISPSSTLDTLLGTQQPWETAAYPTL